MWKAASKAPLTIHTEPATFKTRLTLLSAGMGALDLQEGTSFTGLHAGSVPAEQQLEETGGLGALEAPEIIEDRQWGRTRCVVEVAFDLDKTSRPLFFQIRGCEPTWG